jgi:hypothetical protein
MKEYEDLRKKIEEIYDMISWNMTPGCNQAKKRLMPYIKQERMEKFIIDS